MLFMSEKTSPVADIYLNRDSGVYHFSYENETNWGGKTLEESISEMAKYLRGQHWFKQQRTALVVIGVDARMNHYVLNNPPVWALERLADDYDGKYAPAVKRINNRRLTKVIVRNMILHGKQSVILEANVKAPDTAHGYGLLFPELICLNTQELDAMMTELINLHLLNLAHAPAAKWLRSKYREK